MRKRNCDKWFDNIFWYLLYALPIITSLFTLLNQSDVFWTETAGFTSFTAIFDDFCMKWIGTDNVIFSSLMSVFGDGGIVPLFDKDSWFIFMATWFIGVYMVHLCVDFILFIPRLAHKWLKKGYQED